MTFQAQLECEHLPSLYPHSAGLQALQVPPAQALNPTPSAPLSVAPAAARAHCHSADTAPGPSLSL